MSNFSLKTTAIAVAMTLSSFAAATDLPAYLVQGVHAMGASVAADGSVTYGAMRLVPLLPPNYNPSNAPAGATLSDCTFSPDKVSYVCPGNVQFALMQSTLGEMPHFSDGFSPMQGYSLSADFAPPAGFVMPAGVGLPSGVTVPSLSPADMIAQMTNAGLLPKGAVTFNADGTVTAIVNGVSMMYTPTRIPAPGQQGRYMPGMGYGITAGTGGTVTFPDGTTYVPKVGMMTGVVGMR
ncbi:MAG: hypothetical protein NT159_12655 [Proteobacteria bacterium]|nr:hypothetical protein [Pseudomonadota bacterium]